jgi:rsbT antagonist protein RsbS
METGTIQKLGSLLLVSVPRDLMDEEVLRLRREVSQEVRRHHSRWVLLDFSQVDICDSFFGRFIQSIAEMVGLMGADVIVSGLQDAVIETLVELGMTLPNIQAVLDLDDALALSRTEQQTNGHFNGQLGDQTVNGQDNEYAYGNSLLTDIDRGPSSFADLMEV